MKVMNFKLYSFVLLAVALCGATVGANASSPSQSILPNGRYTRDTVIVTERDTHHLYHNWFVSVSGGTGRLMAEDALKLPFFGEMHFMSAVSAGVWLTPYMGMRLNVNSGALQGFALWNEGRTPGDPGSGGGSWFLGVDTPNPIGRPDFDTYLEAAPDADVRIRTFIKENFLDLSSPRTTKSGSKGYNYNLSYYTAMGDLMFNLNYIFRKYDGHDDMFQFIPFAGIGYAHTLKDGVLPKVDNIALRGGMYGEMRLSKSFSLNAEAAYMIVPEVFDRFVGGNRTQDGVLFLSAGLTYKFGKARAKGCVTRTYNNITVAAPAVVPEPAPEPVVAAPKITRMLVSGRVTDQDGAPLPEATVFVYDKDGQSALALHSDGAGAYSTEVPYGARLMVKAVKNGYLEDCLAFDATMNNADGDAQIAVQDMRLVKLVKNMIIRLDNIHYDFAKWDIRPDAAAELDKVVALLQQSPDIRVELGSHTDSRGSTAYNDRLAQNRAESAVAYIVGKGVNKSRITARGYGERQLLVNCPDGVPCTEAQHQANRRTEIKILETRQGVSDTHDPWSRYIPGRTYMLNELPSGFLNPCGE